MDMNAITTTSRSSSSPSNNTTSSVVVQLLSYGCCAILGGIVTSVVLRRHYNQPRRDKGSASSSSSSSLTKDQQEKEQQQQPIIVDQTSSWKQKRDEERTGRIRAEVKLREALTKLQTLENLQLGKKASKNVWKTTTTRKRNTDSNDDDSDNEIREGENREEDDNDITDANDIFVMRTLGHIISPFSKRMGTPRQGSLVPAVRGCIQFSSQTVDPTSLVDIEQYSHLWVIFKFHQNTNLTTSTKTKIRPPRAPKKVGQLATRSPHRPNPIGLSLVKIDAWVPSQRRLYISALDLVDGTPVYDIKPWVPWDLPTSTPSSALPQSQSSLPITDTTQVNSTTTTDTTTITATPLSTGNNEPRQQQSSSSSSPPPILSYVVPDWVDNRDDVLSSVQWTTQAYTQLQRFIDTNQVHPLLYPPPSNVAASCSKSGSGGGVSSSSSSSLSSLEAAKATIEQILAQDPRSSHRGLTKNKRGTVSSSSSSTGPSSSTATMTNDNDDKNDEDDTKNNDDVYRLQFGQTIVEFVVESEGAIIKNIVQAEKG